MLAEFKANPNNLAGFIKGRKFDFWGTAILTGGVLGAAGFTALGIIQGFFKERMTKEALLGSTIGLSIFSGLMAIGSLFGGLINNVIKTKTRLESDYNGENENVALAFARESFRPFTKVNADNEIYIAAQGKKLRFVRRVDSTNTFNYQYMDGTIDESMETFSDATLNDEKLREMNSNANQEKIRLLEKIIKVQTGIKEDFQIIDIENLEITYEIHAQDQQSLDIIKQAMNKVYNGNMFDVYYSSNASDSKYQVKFDTTKSQYTTIKVKDLDAKVLDKYEQNHPNKFTDRENAKKEENKDLGI